MSRSGKQPTDPSEESTQELRWEPVPSVDGPPRWTAVAPAGAGSLRLECDGLAGRVEVHCDGVPVAESTSAFAPLVVDLPDTGGDRELLLVAHGLDELLATRHPRGRWRNTLVAEQAVRWYRTPMIGLAPFLGDLPVPLGPYRRSRLVAAGRPRWRELAVDTDHDGTTGHLWLRGVLDPAPDGELHCTVAGRPCPVTTGTGPDGLRVEISADLADLEPWWPHVLGEPVLHRLRIDSGAHTLLDTPVGFRRLEVDLAADDDGAGVRFTVNGRALHARGAVWAPVDPYTLRTDPVQLRCALRRMRRGGAVLVRVVGTCVYEEPEFWRISAQEGLLVWQDLMLANSDPPDQPEYTDLLCGEVRDLLRDVAGSPSLAVLSGGSEVRQQAEMSAVPLTDTGIGVLDEAVPAELRRLRPGTTYVPSSPWTPPGHGPAIRVGAGVAHYFGVGGYRRPLSDVREVGVRFAAESLAFAVPPMPWRVDAVFGGAAAAGHDPTWKSGVPRDRRAAWDFEDVRDHYLRTVHGVDPGAVRATDPDRYLALGRSAVVEAMEEVLGWWRSARSACTGGLVLTARDLVPGAGWGMVDDTGVPKCSWYAARHRWAPRVLWVDDRGLDGLWVELHTDDGAGSVPDGRLRVRCHGGTGATVAEGSLPVGGTGPWSVDVALDSVIDPGYALRFGPAAVACVALEWEPADGGDPVRLVWTPRPTTAVFTPPPGCLDARLVEGSETWTVELSCTAPLRHVVVDAPGHVPTDSWFHMAPEVPVRVGLEPVGTPSGRRPRVRIGAEGGVETTARVVTP